MTSHGHLCGHCKGRHRTIARVRECSQTKWWLREYRNSLEKPPEGPLPPKANPDAFATAAVPRQRYAVNLFDQARQHRG